MICRKTRFRRARGRRKAVSGKRPRFFVVNELKSVRFVTEEEIRALETFYQKDMSDLLNDKKGGRK